MKLGIILREENIAHLKKRYLQLKEMEAPTILKSNCRKALRAWQYKPNPLGRFKEFKDHEVLSFSDVTTKTGKWKYTDYITTTGIIRMKKGRFGRYLEKI